MIEFLREAFNNLEYYNKILSTHLLVTDEAELARNRHNYYTHLKISDVYRQVVEL
jgi:hypothetical protein